MIIVARKVVEDLASRGEKLTQSAAVVAGAEMPGYRLYEQALSAQVNFSVLDEPQRKSDSK